MSTTAPDPAASASSADAPSKKIFAPSGANGTLQAAQYTKGHLSLSQLVSDPLQQFHTWFSHAAADPSTPHPETVTLSTAHLPSGRVSARMVYLKELDGTGFVIYSNWGEFSGKARDYGSGNSWAALTFWWEALERQVRVEGRMERLSEAESQVYFDVRARGSRIGAWASEQSKVLKDRGELEERVRMIEERFEGTERIPVPGFWGGMRIVPEAMEFWQGRESRLHDRFRYSRDGEAEGGWRIERLSP
jgi:pyridoxamine 5'-phosphate oxidase